MLPVPHPRGVHFRFVPFFDSPNECASHVNEYRNPNAQRESGERQLRLTSLRIFLDSGYQEEHPERGDFREVAGTETESGGPVGECGNYHPMQSDRDSQVIYQWSFPLASYGKRDAGD